MVADEPRPPSEHERVLSYQEQRFMELGFNVLQAAELAESGVDWHDADRLLEHGCPLEMSLLILL